MVSRVARHFCRSFVLSYRQLKAPAVPLSKELYTGSFRVPFVEHLKRGSEVPEAVRTLIRERHKRAPRLRFQSL